MTTLKLLEIEIERLAYKKAMARIQKKVNIKTWERLDKLLFRYIDEEKEKIIKYMINPSFNKSTNIDNIKE